jgi:type 1 glutamine amidotransferase
MSPHLRGSAPAVLLAALLAPLCPADGERGRGAAPAPDARYSALVFSKTTAFRHTDCITRGGAAIARAGARRGFSVDATEDAGAFTRRRLARYDVVVFLCTSGEVLDARRQRAFRRYIRAGGGFAGIHSAVATEPDWPWYRGLVGADYRDHTGVAGVNAQFQTATIRVEDPDTAATRRLGRAWTREEEWYSFRTDPRAKAHVLLTVDESTYDPRGYGEPGGSPPMGDHPIAWCRRSGRGRSFFTALGHKGVYWDEPLLRSHVLGGIEMAAGAKTFDCD